MLYLLIIFGFIMTEKSAALPNLNSYNHTKKWYKNFADLTGRDSIFIWKYEISNRDYKMYLDALYRENINEYHRLKPDTTTFESETYWSSQDPFTRNYHSHYAFYDFPVVNIGFEGATKYCEWLTGIYNKMPKRKFDKINFRLPDKKESVILLDMLSVDYISDFEEPGKKKYFANLAYWTGPEKIGRNLPCDGGYYMTDVFKYKQHRSGLYSVIGNVAEMTGSGGVYGGSYDDVFSDIENRGKYSPPDPRIGFRIVMEVLSR